MGLLVLSMLNLTNLAQAAEYEVAFEKEDEFMLEIVSFDEDLAEDTLGTDDLDDVTGQNDTEVGDKQKYKITKISEEDKVLFRGLNGNFNASAFHVEFDWWYYTADEEDFEDDPDSDDHSWDVPQDPKDIPDDRKLSFGFVPSNVRDYLNAAEWDKDVNIEGTVFTVKLEEDEMKTSFFKDAKEDIYVEYTFDANTGIITKTRYLTMEDEVILEISTPGLISGYDLPLVFGMVLISVSGLIYTLMKKR